MSKSLKQYIHENDVYDDMVLALESATIEVEKERINANDKIRRLHHSYVFESTSKDYYTEEVENVKRGVFATIGKKVMELIEKFRGMVENVISSIKGIFDKREREMNNVKKIMKDHPEMAKQMVAAMECPDMSLKDIQQFNSECIALIGAYKQSKDMDDATFKSKFKSILEKFNTESKDNKSTIKTVVDVLKSFAAIAGAILSAKTALENINRETNKFKSELEKQGVYQDGKAATIFAAFNQVIGINTKAYHEKVTIQERLGNIIGKVNKEHGDRILDKVKDKKNDNQANIANHEMQEKAKKRKDEDDEIVKNAEQKALEEHTKKKKSDELKQKDDPYNQMSSK